MPYRRQVEHTELITLAKLAGIHASPGVFHVITELMALQVSPEEIYVLLGRICRIPRRKKDDTSRQKSDKTKG